MSKRIPQIIVVQVVTVAVLAGCCLVVGLGEGCKRSVGTRGRLQQGESDAEPQEIAVGPSLVQGQTGIGIAPRWTVKRVEQSGAAAVFDLEQEVERDVDLLMQQLASRLSARDLSQLKTLRRIYSTGQFLREFVRWQETPGNGDLLTRQDRAELIRVTAKWHELEIAIAAFGRTETE